MLQIVDKVTESLKSVMFIETVCIVGSFANGVRANDVDLLLIGTNLDKQELERHLVENFDVKKVFANDDSIACQIEGIDFDLALLSKDMLLWRVKAIEQLQLFAEHRNWCVGYWMPEGFLYDLKRAQIIFDRSDIVRECIDSFLLSYETIRQKLIEEIKKEIQYKSKIKENFMYYNAIARSDVLSAFLRLANLLENWELTSFKHINRKIQSTWYEQELGEISRKTDAQFAVACEVLLNKYFQKND